VSFAAKMLGLAGAAGFGAAAWLLWLRQDEGEPAAPVAMPDLPAGVPAGSSGITAAGGRKGSTAEADANEVEALKRVIASEAGSGTDAERRGVAWTVRNRFRGKSIYAKEFPWRAQKGADPPFSSARPGTAADEALAREVLAADQSQDPTYGATAFFEPRMQDAFCKAGAAARAGATGSMTVDGVRMTDVTRFKAYRKDADEIRASWGRSDACLAVAGRFELWGRKEKLARLPGGAPVVMAGDLELMGAAA